MIPSKTIDYADTKTPLCELGKKYDTDKTPWRENLTDKPPYRHAHPYTCFYDNLFKTMKDKKLVFGELGILYGSSMWMWREYFKNADIYGFEYDINLINEFHQKNKENIKIDTINVNDINNIRNTLAKYPLFDILIDDTTHQMRHQINVIKFAFDRVKPGGYLIIEDIYEAYNENDYYIQIKEFLKECSEYYFVKLDHSKKFSKPCYNDKLLVLKKKQPTPKICVFMTDNRPLVDNIEYAKYNTLSVAINKYYCDKQGYDFYYYRPYYKDSDSTELFNCPDPYNSENQRHSAWARILVGLDLMMNKDYDYYMYLDTDAIFKEQDRRIEELIDEMVYDIIFQNDEPHYLSTACTGVFVLKKNANTIQFLKDWYRVNAGYYNRGRNWDQSGLYILFRLNKYPYTITYEKYFNENSKQFIRHYNECNNHLRTPTMLEYIKENNINFSDVFKTIKVIDFDTSKASY